MVVIFLNIVRTDSCTLLSRSRLNRNTELITFSLPSTAYDVPPGMHVEITLRGNNKDELEITRPMTPLSVDPNKATIDFVMKYYQKGELSERIQKLAVGDTAEISEPKGDYDMEHLRKYKRVVMIAAGTGIVPLWRIAEKMHHNFHSIETLVLYANEREEDILLRKEFEDLQHKWDSFSARYIVANPPTDLKDYTLGWISDEVLDSCNLQPDDTCALICGSIAMEQFVVGALKQRGFEEDDIVAFTSRVIN